MERRYGRRGGLGVGERERRLETEWSKTLKRVVDELMERDDDSRERRMERERE